MKRLCGDACDSLRSSSLSLSDRDDIFQLAYLKTYKRFVEDRNHPALQEIDSFERYFRMVVRNTAYDHLKNARKLVHFGDGLGDELANGEIGSPGDVESAQPEERPEAFFLDAAIRKLPETEQKIISMKYQDKLTYEEIGRRLGLSGEAARKRLSRAIQELRRSLLQNNDA